MHHQEAVLEFRVDALLVDRARQLERAREAAVAPLDYVVPALGVLAGGTLLLSTNREHAVFRGHLDVAWLDARKLHLEHDLFIVLANIYGRRPTAGTARVTTERVLEQAIYLSSQTE